MDLNTGNVLLIGSILLFGSILAGKAGSRFGVPALLLFLGVGMLFGEQGLASWFGREGMGIRFDSPATMQFIGMMALSVILFSGGMDTRMEEIKPVLAPGLTLATVGVLLTALITGVFIYYMSGELMLAESLLLAAVMSSTDSASVFSILRSKKQGLKQNLRPLLELESGSNDPMAYMLTVLLIQVIQVGDFSVWAAVWMFVKQMVIGLVAGYLLGWLAIWSINKINIDNRSMYGVLLLAFCFFIFSMTDLINGNGYLAVYIAGLMVGNHKIVFKRSMTTFFDGFTWLFQIVMFLALGLLVNPAELIDVALFGLLIGAFMIIFSRPVSVLLCMLPFRKFTTKARIYVSWVGLRGAVPIIFATYPLIAGLEYSQLMFNVVFFITLLSLLAQGTTVSSMANLLGLSTEEKSSAFDLDLPDKVRSSLSEIEVQPVLLAQGERLRDLILPDNTLVVMVKRGEDYFVPKGSTKLAEGDKLLVISDNDEELRRELDQMGVVSQLKR